MNRALQTLRGASVFIPVEPSGTGPSEAEFATALAQVEADMRELELVREQLRAVAEDTTIADLRADIADLEMEFERQLERKDEALRHYASPDYWREATLQADYMIFEYDGGHELPWQVAQEALRARVATSRCHSLHPHPTKVGDFFIRCELEEGHDGEHRLEGDTWSQEETYLMEG